jgi:homoserine kinase
MEQGNILMISECVKDKIHEPYRYPLIESGEVIKACVQELGGVVTISGSGPALLVMTLESDFACKLASIHRLLDWQIMKLEVDSLGTIIFD